MCAKFKANRLSRFCTKDHWVFTSQKSFINKIPVTMKTATPSFLNTFSDQTIIFKISFFASQVNIWIPARYFSFLVPFFNEMKETRIVSNKNQGRRTEHMSREVTLNRESDYLKLAAFWIKFVKSTYNKCIPRKVAGLPEIQQTIYFFCSLIF